MTEWRPNASVVAGLLPFLYRLLRIKVFAQSRVGVKLFVPAYFLYKRWIEDPHAGLVRRQPALTGHGHIIDVGANVGYTASVFSRAVRGDQRVFAFEPDPQNFRLLERTARRLPAVIPMQCAIGDHNGTATLLLNPDHPGDHRVVAGSGSGGPTVVVELQSLDSFVESLASAMQIAFVKVDVQGYELAVCEGMAGLLSRQPQISVSFEYSGTASESVAEFFARRGFSLYLIRKSGRLEHLDRQVLSATIRRRGYCDLLATKRAVTIA